MPKILEVSDLTVSYGGKEILSNINMNLEQGEILGIVGESGSGKTTLLKAILGILPVSGTIECGNITLFKKCIKKLNKEELRSLRGKDVAIIFQNPGTYLNPIKIISTQFVEVIMNHKYISKSEANELIRSTILKMNLPNPDRIMKSYPFELSGGMLQRVCIAMAMALHPKIILADEPTSALDVSISRVIVEEMMKLRETEGTSFIVVTHDIGIAAHIADRIVVMKNGKIVEMGKPNDVVTDPKDDYTKLLIGAIPLLGGLH
ncbi:ABC transporter ATP-binding protein [Methanomethylovorans sp.]|uniref:ABC transporter ATP-binding protein n=1 Tax=Methanomethylovorans sp. TaxID=2758717 RepID=UPI001BD364D7|nr:ABC transporter ATP-binding protein [Methanomethylovorans sp.]